MDEAIAAVRGELAGELGEGPYRETVQGLLRALERRHGNPCASGKFGFFAGAAAGARCATFATQPPAAWTWPRRWRSIERIINVGTTSSSGNRSILIFNDFLMIEQPAEATLAI